MEILELTETKKHTAKATEDLYKKAFPRVARYVSRLGGSFEEARDIFHDALVIFFENREQTGFNLHTSEEAYILGIARHLWLRKYNAPPAPLSLDETELQVSVPEDYFPTVEHSRLLRFLKTAGKKCMDLLRGFYFEHLSVKKLAEKQGYPNAHAVSVQKYKCLEKVRSAIQQRSLSYEDFIQ